MDNTQHTKQRVLSSVFALFLSTLFYTGADAAERRAERPLQKVTIAYSSISGTMAPLWVTYAAGFFRKHGLDMKLVFIKGGSKAVKALVSGDVDVAQVGGAGVLRSNLKGSDAVMIAGFLNTMNYEFIVDKNIKRPEQLKGKAVAVSRFGGSSDFATRYAIDKFGLVPEKDVAILEIGTQSDRLAALQNGKVQGVMLAVPHTLLAKKMGFSTLVSLHRLGLEYQHTGLATTKALIESQPELLRRVMRAYVEGIHFYKTHRREALTILQKYLKTDDIEALDETYNVLALTLLPEKPYPTLRGIRIMLQRLAKKYPKAQTAKPERFVDLTFVMELDRSGFIDSLYKPTVATREKRQPTSAPARLVHKPTPATAVAKSDTPSPSMPEPTPATAVAKGVTPPPSMPEPKPATAVAKGVTPPPSTLDGVRKYTVKAGDTLSRLAFRYYGDASSSKWMKIYEANKQTVINPHHIIIGQIIVIPPSDRVKM